MVDDSRTAKQRGAGRLGGIFTLAVFVAFCYAVFNVGPVYLADFSLGDKMQEICRLGRGQNPDERISELLMGAVRDQRLEDYVPKANFKIHTRENSRRIQLEYERTVKILPGWVRTFQFSHDVDQPFF
jgi:hypothetical protein